MQPNYITSSTSISIFKLISSKVANLPLVGEFGVGLMMHLNQLTANQREVFSAVVCEFYQDLICSHT